METLEYRLLGSLEARSDGRVARLGPPKQRAVLAILLLHAGETVSSDRLIELVWGKMRLAPRGIRSRSTCPASAARSS